MPANRDFRTRGTPRFRKQVSLRRLMLVTALLGINFAWLPWPACVFPAIAIVLAGFVARITLVECLYCAAVVLVLVAVSMPPHGHRSRRISRAVVAPRPTAAPTSPSAN
jgi:hypothetical protein